MPKSLMSTFGITAVALARRLQALLKTVLAPEDPSHMLFTSALSETRLSTALLQLKENVEGTGAAKDRSGKLNVTLSSVSYVSKLIKP